MIKAKNKKHLEKPFRSKNGLPFETAGPWWRDPTYIHFRVGTVTGAYGAIGTSYGILVIENSEPGNGHFEDALQWFEQSARRDGYSLIFLAVMNRRFKEHLITKRGFTDIGDDNVEKRFS